MQRFKRIGLLILTNLLIMVGIYIIIFILERFVWIQIGGNTLGILFYGVIIWFGGSLVSLYMSKGMAKRMYNIQLIDSSNLSSLDPKLQEFYKIVSSIAQRQNLPLPEIGVYESAEANAFATGPSKSSSLVAASTGLLAQMTTQEVEGVMGHEMSHISNGDMVTMTLLQGIMNTFVFFLSRILALWGSNSEGERGFYNPWVALICELIFGTAGSLVVNQFSQHREFKADEGSARLLGKQPMIAALEKLRIISAGDKIPNDELATLKISGGSRAWLKLFATHPSLESRIERLRAIAV